MSVENPVVNLTPTVPRKGDPCVLVIFGASGDLTKRKLIPSLFHLAGQKILADNFIVLGLARSDMPTEQYREKVKPDGKELDSEEGQRTWKVLADKIFYMAGDVNEVELYQQLKATLGKFDNERGTGSNYMFYMAVAPEFFATITKGLAESGLLNESNGHWRRVIIEKPFGHDLPSAKKLNADIKRVMSESQIYRIDHYLGKETVQNLMVFRFGNSIFEPIWNRSYVDHVQITVAEELGVEGRGSYFDHAGSLRDMTPNHIAQLLTMVAMEPPVSFNADAVRDEQVKLLKSIQTLSEEDVLHNAVRGQYGLGEINNQKVPGYREEEGVNPESTTETYIAMKLAIDNWRWGKVPFYVRTGKRLAKRVTEIAIQFKQAPFLLFRNTAVDRLATNRLFIRIQPNEGISLRFGAKLPGPVLDVAAVRMNFEYKDAFRYEPNTGYETLLYDCMIGDQTLFQRADMVEAGWRMVQPVIDVWQALPPRNFPNYRAGTWGPTAADELIGRDGRHWETFLP